jgi:N-acetylmuramoyl-L-alanine amidase
MKKAQVPVAVYFRIFEIILLVLVVSIIALEVSNVRGSGIYQKKFLARDLALFMDSVTNARGNLFYQYQPPGVALQNFTIDFVGGQVVVDGETWPYATNTLYTMEGPRTFKNAELLVMKKVGNTFTLEAADTKKQEFNGLLMECPKAFVDLKKVIIDPGHGYNPITKQGEQGVVGAHKDTKGRQIPESELALSIGAALQQQLKKHFPGLKDKIITIITTRSLKFEFISLPAILPVPFLAEETKTTQERLAMLTANPEAAVISLHVGKAKPDQNVVKAFVNKDANIQTYRLACTVLNAIAMKYKYPLQITGNAIIPVDLEQLSADDPKKLLLKNQAVVQIELGNIDHPNNKLYENIPELADAIATGVKVFGS